MGFMSEIPGPALGCISLLWLFKHEYRSLIRFITFMQPMNSFVTFSASLLTLPTLSNFSDTNVVFMTFIVNLLDLSSFETLVFGQVAVISLTMFLHIILS